MFHVVREYKIKNLFLNKPILQVKEVKHRLVKKPKKNIYLIRKYNKTKRLKKY